MALFNPAFVEVMKRETPYRMDGNTVTFLPKVTKDSGGLTKWGISSKAYPNLDIANLSYDDAKGVYTKIWNDSQAGNIKSQASANMYFDHAVNAGITSARSIAVNALKYLGADISARPTLETLISTINKYPTNFPAAFTQKRVDFYNALGEKNPAKYGDYTEGWEARAKSFFPLARPR